MKVDKFFSKLKRTREKLDVVLIHTETFYESRFNYFNMGLLYIATILQNEGFRVRCIGVSDLFNMTHHQLRRIFTISRPEIAGFYTISDNQYLVENLAAQIKKWRPSCRVVVGGPLATSLGEKMLNFEKYDICVVGEGEEPMLQLANLVINKRGSLDEIPGIIYRQNGKIIANPPALPIKNLDDLPFPDHSLAGNSMVFPVVSGRGCPYQCIFCFQGVHGLKYRFRPADDVAEEIISNLETGKFHSFHIIDDTFISNPARVRKIADKLEKYRKQSGRDFLFFCQGRVDVIEKHPDLIPRLKRAGLVRVQIGLESGHPRTLEIYNKRISVDQIRNVVQQVKEAGNMTVVGNFIIGGPHENKKSFEDSLNLAVELVRSAPGVFEAVAGFLGPYPGTPIARCPAKYGLSEFDVEFKKGQTLSDVHLETENLDYNDLRQEMARFYDRVIKEMEKNLPRVSRSMLASHFVWADDFKFLTYWYQLILSKKQALADYFYFMKSPRFSTLDFIAPEDLLNWYPQRVKESRRYSRDSRQILLPETVGKYQLKKKNEILIYELASGKLTMEQLLDEYLKETQSGKDRMLVLHKEIIPTLKKLEKTFHVVFYK